MKGYLNLILKTAAVASCVSVLIITGCQGGNEAAAVKNKSEAKETSIVSEKDREEDIEAVVRSNGLTGQDTKDLRNDLERETTSDGRRPEVTVEAEPSEDEGGDAGEEDSGTDDRDSGTEADDSSEPMPELVESEPSGDAGSEGSVDEYTEYAEDGYSDGYGDEHAGSDDTESYSEEGSGFNEDEFEDTVERPVQEVPAEPEGAGGDLTYLGTWASTGYCACSICCGQWASGYTASGTYATEGRTVACGSLPMGTTIYIEGWGYRVVEDLGVEGEWVDIFYADHSSASAHGLQYVDVYLVN